jgi:peptide deformylase
MSGLPDTRFRPIRMFGDPVLRRRAGPVTDFDSSLRRLVLDVSETLADAGWRRSGGTATKQSAI